MCILHSYKDGWTALHCAAGEGRLDCIKWLVNNTTLMVDHETNVSGTVILCACMYIQYR